MNKTQLTKELKKVVIKTTTVDRIGYATGRQHKAHTGQLLEFILFDLDKHTGAWIAVNRIKDIKQDNYFKGCSARIDFTTEIETDLWGEIQERKVFCDITVKAPSQDKAEDLLVELEKRLGVELAYCWEHNNIVNGKYEVYDYFQLDGFYGEIEQEKKEVRQNLKYVKKELGIR